MRKGIALFGASLCLGWVVPARAQESGLRDVPPDHWAYQAVTSLQQKGIIKGYPNGTFSGKRTLTRNEFAVALDRAVKAMSEMVGSPGQVGPPGEPGPKGEPGLQGPAGMVPEEITTFRRLLGEFKDELAKLGTDVRAANARLDRLEAAVREARAQLAKMPVWSGVAYGAVRSDSANGPYVDADGRITPLKGRQLVVTGLGLNVQSPVSGDTKVSAGLAFTNYVNALGGNVAEVRPFLNQHPGGDALLEHLEVKTPLHVLGRGSELTLGRFRHNISPLVLWRPTVDSYLQIPMFDDPYYRMDGARASLNFGSVNLTAFGAQLGSVQDTAGNKFNEPLAGVDVDRDVFWNNRKPVGQFNPGPGTVAPPLPNQQVPPGQLGQMTVDSVAGVTVGLNTNFLGGGHIRASALDTHGTGGAGMTGVFVLGADFDFKPAPRFDIAADWAKAIPHIHRDNGFNSIHVMAFDARVAYRSGPLGGTVGYRYVDPFFYSPGYWGRIGNWINPTNIQGPTLNLDYRLSPMLALSVGGDYYQPTLEHANGMDVPFGGLDRKDSITRLLAGLKFNASRLFQISVDWERDLWRLEGPHEGVHAMGTGVIHPIEDYVTLGTAYHLTDTTAIKLSYQIGHYDGHGSLLAPTIPAVASYNYNVFTSQLNVAF